MKYLYYESKDTYFSCKCYLTDDGNVIFETNSCGADLQYHLSGHPYEPILYAKCNIPRYTFEIHGGLWFPVHDADKTTNSTYWQSFCEELSLNINLRVAWLHDLPDEYGVDFSILKPNGYLRFNGQNLLCCYFPKRNINSHYLEPALFVGICNIGMDVKIISGGFPGENYIMISDMTVEQKMSVTTENGEPIVKRKKDYNEIMEKVINGEGPYDLERDLKYKGDLFTPTILELKHGFTKRIEEGGIKEYKKTMIIKTTADGIMFGGHRFVGEFDYDITDGENDIFQKIELLPVLVNRNHDNFYDEQKIKEENNLCKEVVSLYRNRIGRFLLSVHEYYYREKEELVPILRHTSILVREHPFFTELNELLEDSSMTDEEVANFETHIETLLDKYKYKL